MVLITEVNIVFFYRLFQPETVPKVTPQNKNSNPVMSFYTDKKNTHIKNNKKKYKILIQN